MQQGELSLRIPGKGLYISCWKDYFYLKATQNQYCHFHTLLHLSHGHLHLILCVLFLFFLQTSFLSFSMYLATTPLYFQVLDLTIVRQQTDFFLYLNLKFSRKRSELFTYKFHFSYFIQSSQGMESCGSTTGSSHEGEAVAQKRKNIFLEDMPEDLSLSYGEGL